MKKKLTFLFPEMLIILPFLMIACLSSDFEKHEENFKKLNPIENISIEFRNYCYNNKIITPVHENWEAFIKNYEYHALRFVNYSYEHEVSRGDHEDWIEFMNDPAYYDTHVKNAQEEYDNQKKK
jgi:hypothetical protein